MIILSFGGGTNSTALCIGLRDRGIIPDLILFADTGGEKPHTYKHIDDMQIWLKKNNFPPITKAPPCYPTQKKDGTLENECLRLKGLPSKVYNMKSCSVKWKIDPQDRYVKKLPEALAVWESGEKITKYIGYDLGENHRVKDYTDEKYILEYPLVDWGWDRDDCIAAIEREGLPQPAKSACFFCPSSKQGEIRELAVLYPDLMERAIAMEKNSEVTNIEVKGLGRTFKWSDVVATDDMFPENYIDQSCGCYDGD